MQSAGAFLPRWAKKVHRMDAMQAPRRVAGLQAKAGNKALSASAADSHQATFVWRIEHFSRLKDVLKKGRSSSIMAGISLGSKYDCAKVHILVKVRMLRFTLGGCEPPDSEGRTNIFSSLYNGRQSSMRSLPGRR